MIKPNHRKARTNARLLTASNPCALYWIEKKPEPPSADSQFEEQSSKFGHLEHRLEPRLKAEQSTPASEDENYWNVLPDPDNEIASDHHDQSSEQEMPAPGATATDPAPAMEDSTTTAIESDWEDDIPVLTEVVESGEINTIPQSGTATADNVTIRGELNLPEETAPIAPPPIDEVPTIAAATPSADTVTRTVTELLDEFFNSLGYEDDLESLDQLSKSAMECVNNSVMQASGTPMHPDHKRQLRRQLEDLLVDWARQYQQKLKKKLTGAFDN